MSESIETRLERLAAPVPADPRTSLASGELSGRGVPASSIADDTLPRSPRSAIGDDRPVAERLESLTWQVPDAEPGKVPVTTAVQRRVVEAYTGLHGHPLEHDGRMAAAQRRSRWKLSLRSGVSLILLITVMVAIVLSLESWNSAEVSRELGQHQREEAATDGLRGGNVAAEAEGSHIEADPGEGGRNEVEEGPTPADAGEPSALTVFVHVTGQVVSPGLYELPMNARVYDAIEAAGGPTDSADTDAINLASPLIDGQQLLVPKPGELPPPMDTANGQALDGQASQDSTAASVNPTGAGAASGGGRVNINTATAEQLDTLPGVGPAIAQRIIEFRETHGGFTTVTDLRSVSGIGPAMMSKLQDLVTVDGL